MFVRELAPALLEALQPGLGPMLIPADIARVIAAAHGWRQEWRLIPSVDDLTLSAHAQPDGALALSLRWQGGTPVWSGILRPAAPVASTEVHPNIPR